MGNSLLTAVMEISVSEQIYLIIILNLSALLRFRLWSVLLSQEYLSVIPNPILCFGTHRLGSSLAGSIPEPVRRHLKQKKVGLPFWLLQIILTSILEDLL